LVKIFNEAPQNRLSCHLYISDCHAIFAIKKKLEKFFDTNASPDIIREALVNNGHFAKLPPQIKGKIENILDIGLRLPGCWDPFELAVRAVIGQQISVKAATTICSRLVERTGVPYKFSVADDVFANITHHFPTPEKIKKANMDKLGLTTTRIQTIKALSAAIVDNQLNLNSGSILNTQKLLQQLMQIRGIGKWTSTYIAMRAQQDPDVYPLADLVIEKNLSSLINTNNSKEVDGVLKQFRPWRAYAAILIWQLSPFI